MMTKTIFKTVLLSAALTGTMVSCQKDSEMVPSQELSQKSLAQETSILFYKIDGEEYYQKFSSEKDMRDNFFNRVLEDDKIFLWGLEEMTGKIRMYESYQ